MSAKSTTDRSRTLGRRVAAGLVRAGARIAPELTAHWVIDRFASPVRTAPRPGEPTLRVAPTWQRVRGQRLAVYGDGPGAPVLLVHGWNGGAHDLATLAAAIADAGFRAVTFDMPGHGVSPGRRLTLLDMTRLARGVADTLGPLAGVVGHSLGAAAAVLALRDGLEARSAVAIAPPRRMQPFLTGFTRAVGLGPTHDDAIRRAIEARVGPFTQFDVDRAARTLATPGLVLHDVGDRQVPFADGVEIAESWPGASLVAVQGLGHRRLLHDPDVARQVVRFLLDHGVPSAAPRSLGAVARPAAVSRV
jgi:pimeloyl-ACP methyl ester carboxylesterase